MIRDWLRENRVALAFLVGILYAGCLYLAYELMDADAEDQERIGALRYENSRLHAAIRRATAGGLEHPE